MRNRRDFNPRNRARMLAWGIAAVVTAVVIAMGAAATISINQSQEAALKNMRADAANLAFAFDEDVTHTLDTIEGAMQAVANRMAARQSKMNLYALSQQFPIITAPDGRGGHDIAERQNHRRYLDRKARTERCERSGIFSEAA